MDGRKIASTIVAMKVRMWIRHLIMHRAHEGAAQKEGN